jgi:16S rRNA (adenine1518-N6/adenine1519-N6)-dimethyltransferase
MKHTARKRFGQHFLRDAHAIAAIVDAIAPHAGDCMIEIGPGLGALTEPLCNALNQLTVVELDRDLAAHLRRNSRLRVIESDVLRVDFNQLGSTLGSPGNLRVVGNLPYNVSTPILFHLLEFAQCVQDQHFMLQKEVVDRMVAKAGSSEFSRLSVMLQWRYRMEKVLDIAPDCFEPIPRVDSAVVRMVPLATAPDIEVARLSELVQVAFSQRRKLMRNTLGPWLDQRGFSGMFDLQRRAQEVKVEEYVQLARQLEDTSDVKPQPASN